MEKERFFVNPNAPSWNSSDPQTPPGLNSGRPPPPPCFLNLNWDQSMDQSAAFESALSSLVSSPTSNQPESIVIHELIGRLGSICNSGGISPPSRFQSADTSCYSTPMNSPPKFNLSVIDGRGGIPVSAKLVPFSPDPGFAERAARLSCFGGDRSYPQFGLAESGKLSSLNEISMQDRTQLEMGTRPRFRNRLSGSTTPEDREFALEESSASDHFVAARESNARKRKAPPKGKGKEASKVIGEEDTNAKRSRSPESNGTEKDTAIKPKAEQNGGANANGDADKKLVSKENNAKPAEPPKDYIHVRARRGQATDSHSLAERVRREKISERMKFLQDLVPGCNKVTGKAVMLDEIINYVQSLQRQVEFLSMKLATVNPRLDFNIENIIQKEMNQTHGHMPPHSIYPFDVTSAAFAYNHQTQGTTLQSAVTNGLETHYSMNPLDSGIRQSLSMLLNPVDGFGDATSQLGTLWEDDLHSVVHMGIDHSQEAAFSSQSFHGLLPAAHMKIEL